MTAEQMLIRIIRSHGDIQTMSRLCDEIENLNEAVDVPFPDDTAHTFTDTFLSLAIVCDNVEAVDLLLQKGADPNFTDSNLFNSGSLLYDLSVFIGSTAEEAKRQLMITKLMLDHGADPNQVILKKRRNRLSARQGEGVTRLRPVKRL